MVRGRWHGGLACALLVAACGGSGSSGSTSANNDPAPIYVTYAPTRDSGPGNQGCASGTIPAPRLIALGWNDSCFISCGEPWQRVALDLFAGDTTLATYLRPGLYRIRAEWSDGSNLAERCGNGQFSYGSLQISDASEVRLIFQAE